MAETTLNQTSVAKSRRTFCVTAVQTGIVMALLAVVAGTFMSVSPPKAYGICMACHGRDLVNWTLNTELGAHLIVSQASAVFPLLTTVGVVIGALVAAISSGEFRWRNPDNPFRTFVYGILIMNFALLAAGCSIRLLLRMASGELLGVVGVGGLVIGIILSTSYLQWRARL